MSAGLCRKQHSAVGVAAVLVLAATSLAFANVGFCAGAAARTATRGLVARSAAPALAPAPVRPVPHPGLPARIDETRFGERVRWLMDEDAAAMKPPHWNVLLLDKTYRNPTNTIARVAAVLVSVLSIAAGLAQAKARHAKDHYFSAVHTSRDWAGAIRIAQSLQSRGLVVRVTPGVQLPPMDDGNGDALAGPQTATSGAGRRSW